VYTNLPGKRLKQARASAHPPTTERVREARRLDPRAADLIFDTPFVEGMEPGRHCTKRDISFVPLREQRLACRLSPHRA
jgi:hypothetical protein